MTNLIITLTIIVVVFSIAAAFIFRAVCRSVEDALAAVKKEYDNDKEYWLKRDYNRINEILDQQKRTIEVSKSQKADAAKNFKVLTAIAKSLLREGEILKVANDHSKTGPVIGFIFKRLEESSKGVVALTAANEEYQKRIFALSRKLSHVGDRLGDIEFAAGKGRTLLADNLKEKGEDPSKPKVVRSLQASEMACDSVHPGMTLRDMHTSKARPSGRDVPIMAQSDLKK